MIEILVVIKKYIFFKLEVEKCFWDRIWKCESGGRIKA